MTKIKFKSTVNEVEHRKYNILVYCKKEDEKSFQFLVEMSYRNDKEFIIVKPVEIYSILEQNDCDEIIEEAKNSLIDYLYKKLKGIATVFHLEQNEYIIAKEDNYSEVVYLINCIIDVKYDAIKHVRLTLNGSFFSNEIEECEDAWVLCKTETDLKKKIQTNHPVTITVE